MKPINENVLHYMHKIQDLAVNIPNIHVYYQQDTQLFEVYVIKNKEHIYSKNIYLDCFPDKTESEVILKLVEIINDLEAMINENRGKNKNII